MNSVPVYLLEEVLFLVFFLLFEEMDSLIRDFGSGLT